jgi:hypothetical protein
LARNLKVPPIPDSLTDIQKRYKKRRDMEFIKSA